MKSVGQQGRTRRRARNGRGDQRSWAVLRFPIAMLLVLLALPLGTIGTASAEDATSDAPAPSEATSQAAEPSGSTGAADGPEQSEQSEQSGQSEQADATGEPTEEGTTVPAEPTGPAGPTGPTGPTGPQESSEPPASSDPAPTGPDATVQPAGPEAAAAGPEPFALVAPISQTGGFEIDGDVAVNNGGKDWATTGTRIVDGAGDTTVYTEGSELSDPREWQDTSNASAPGNDDIVAAYSHTEMVGGQLWVFFGFERAAASGTSNYVIEYNRLANWSDEPARPRRSPGDLRIRVTQGGSGAFFVAGVERWSATSGPGCAAVTARDKTVVGYWCPAPDATPYFTGVSSDDKIFAEGALNLSGLLGGADNCLGGYGVVNMRSFSGGSESSQLKDYVAGTPVTVPSTCGYLEILKVDQFGDPVPGATFRVVPDAAPGGGAGPLTVTDGGAGDPDGTADGTITIDPARPGAYTVTETGVPAGHLPPDDDTQEAVVPQNGGDSVTFVNARTFEPLTATNEATATYDVTYDWKLTKSVDSPRLETPEGTPARADYTVTLEALPEQRDGHEVGGTLTITNPNQKPVVATVDAGLTGDVGCDFTAADASPADGHQVEVEPGTHAFEYTCRVTGTPGDGTSTATVGWDGDRYPPVPGTDPGNPVTATDDYTFEVDRVTDEQVTVSDAFDGGAAEELGTFTWSDVWSSTDPAAHTVVVPTEPREITGVPGECTSYDNVATATEGDSGQQRTDTATVEVCVGRDLDVDKTVGVSYTRTYGWDLAKSGPATVFVGDDGHGEAGYDITVTATQPMDTGVSVSGTITLSNPNDWDVVADVTDSFTLRGVAYPCTVAGGADVLVPGDDAVVLGYTCDLSSLPGDVWPNGYDGANEVTVTWDQSEYFSPGDDVVFTNHVEPPEVSETPAFDAITLVDEIAEAGGASQAVDLGGAGDLTWADVWAEDGHQVTLEVPVDLDTSLAAGTCTTYTNVVAVPGAPIQPAEAETEVCRPGIEKSVDATYERVHEWTIDKVADETDVVVGTDGTRTFTYTVSVAPDGFHDVEQSLAGVITVTNPSATADLVVDVEDVSGVQGWVCTADGAGLTVPPGGSVPVDYTCAPPASGAHPSGTNTATATFGDASVSVTEDVVFERVAATDATIEVTDPKAPDGVLGTADWADGERQFTYEWTSPVGEPGTCATYDNTATITSTGQTASESVRVCTEAPLEVASAVTATMERDHEWTIDKEASRRHVQLFDADPPASVDYTVTVTPGDRVDSAWALSGATTVRNANDFTDLTVELDQLTDVGEDVVCEYDDGATLTVPADGSAEAPFTCSLEGTSYTDGTLTTQASWGDDDTSTTTTPVAFEVVSETGALITVHDDLAEPDGEGRVLGTVEWNAEGTPTEFAYTSTHDAPADEPCPVYTNTAQIVESGQEAQSSVTVCRTRTAGEQTPDPDPDDTDTVSVVSTGPTSGLPNTGAPAGMLQLGALGLLASMLGLVLVWHSRRLRRQE